jgi:hypothetical protein
LVTTTTPESLICTTLVSQNIRWQRQRDELRVQVREFRNRYPKRIKYGNRTSQLLDSFGLQDEAWMFEVVFDYGDHDEETPHVRESRP